MKKLIAAVFVLSGFALPSLAQTGKYGMGGCGVGSLIFEDKPGKIQILAATTNDYFGQTFSITTGTSNCTEMSSREEAMLFIHINQEALAKDISRGGGETVVGLAKIMKCSHPDRLGSELQRDYSKIFPAGKSATDAAHTIDSMVRENPVLKNTCAIYS